MSDLQFGFTMAIAGMSVTFIALCLLIVVIGIMNRLYPYKEDDKKAHK